MECYKVAELTNRMGKGMERHNKKIKLGTVTRACWAKDSALRRKSNGLGWRDEKGNARRAREIRGVIRSRKPRYVGRMPRKGKRRASQSRRWVGGKEKRNHALHLSKAVLCKSMHGFSLRKMW